MQKPTKEICGLLKDLLVKFISRVGKRKEVKNPCAGSPGSVSSNASAETVVEMFVGETSTASAATVAAVPAANAATGASVSSVLPAVVVSPTVGVLSDLSFDSFGSDFEY